MLKPLEPDELLKLCSLAGEADVLTVGAHPVASWGIFARLEFRRIVRGRVRRVSGERLRHAIVMLREPALDPQGRMLLGEWTDMNAYRPGTSVFTYLTWECDWEKRLGVYRTTWPNAVTRLARR